MNTRGSRRISSARASFTASPIVNSRVATIVSGIDILVHLVWSRIRSGLRKLYSFVYFSFDFFLHGIQLFAVDEVFVNQRVREKRHRITLGLPRLLFLFRAVVLTIHIADVMPVEPICLTQ